MEEKGESVAKLNLFKDRHEMKTHKGQSRKIDGKVRSMMNKLERAPEISTQHSTGEFEGDINIEEPAAGHGSDLICDGDSDCTHEKCSRAQVIPPRGSKRFGGTLSGSKPPKRGRPKKGGTLSRPKPCVASREPAPSTSQDADLRDAILLSMEEIHRGQSSSGSVSQGRRSVADSAAHRSVAGSAAHRSGAGSAAHRSGAGSDAHRSLAGSAAHSTDSRRLDSDSDRLVIGEVTQF